MRDKVTIKTITCICCLALGIGYAIARLIPTHYTTTFDIESFSEIPIQQGGRIKPLDTLARNSLLILSGKQTVNLQDKKETLNASLWLMDVTMRPEAANTYKIFRIDNDEVLGLFGWEQNTKRFSFNDLEPHLAEIFKQASQVNPIKELRSPFEQQIESLYESLLLYNELMVTFSTGIHPDHQQEEYGTWLASIRPGMEAIKKQQLNETLNQEFMNLFISLADRYLNISKKETIGIVPPISPKGKEENSWSNLGQALLDTIITGEINPAIINYSKLIISYRNSDAEIFNEAIASIKDQFKGYYNPWKIKFEVFLNYFEPFYVSSFLYVLAFLMICISWLFSDRRFIKSASLLVLLSLVIHTFGLIGRMYLQGRPPVTNLYSSAIFVGWVSVLLGIIFEKVYKNGVGLAVASIIGFSTLIIAHNLGLNGDTLEMVRAVLDSNFWLSTHVIVVTMGYSAMFLTGTLGIIYILVQLRQKNPNPAFSQSLAKMAYGSLAFATLFSFVGTMLGGIWADQSWGRFWGWDPKENGALLIVLWCGLMLHAHWGKLVKDRGFMVLAVFGNIVTSWSWFGTNMLGVGLHTYGFMDKAFWALFIFILSQLVIIAIGLFHKLRLFSLFYTKK